MLSPAVRGGPSVAAAADPQGARERDSPGRAVQRAGAVPPDRVRVGGGGGVLHGGDGPEIDARGGGEPLLQIDFLTELFMKAKAQGIHTCIDTSGIVFKPDNKTIVDKMDVLMQYTDLVMLDIKHINPEEHMKLCSQPNDGILAFAEYLSDKGIPTWIRHVVVPGITDNEKYLYQLGLFIGKLKNVKALDVLPYHTMGVVKYENLGFDYPLKGVPAESKEAVIKAKSVIIKGIKEARASLNNTNNNTKQ